MNFIKLQLSAKRNTTHTHTHKIGRPLSGPIKNTFKSNSATKRKCCVSYVNMCDVKDEFFILMHLCKICSICNMKVSFICYAFWPEPVQFKYIHSTELPILEPQMTLQFQIYYISFLTIAYENKSIGETYSSVCSSNLLAFK